ncbi:hypothetical protein EN45_002480 [Penicillium chrysogenum]|jgi:hypothetical protein|uniref:Uncharacterized protein n=2 Tax=Penicillium chrysogenum species complex TaxID=254878 RepID=B6HTV2_PENRW|nr:hypothetical protein EN45_002480 [Penicillium chrysogenum]CAP99937.1 hypothetical protein PCH_Pc22g26490 [Penicillium rubens Wisconsin 54-1255]
MSSQEIEAISAFSLLCNTPSEIIQTHRELATKTIRHIVKILDTSANVDTVINAFECGVAHSPPETIPDAEIRHLSSTTHGSSQHIDAQNPLHFQRPVITSAIQSGHDIARKRKRETLDNSPSIQLLRRVKQRLSHILEFSKKQVSLSEILHDEQETQYRDKRVDHLKQVDGNKTPSNEQKLLKGLSQISLAQQFTQWERKWGWKAKVDELYDNLQRASTNAKYQQHIGNNRSGKITRYIRDYGYPQSDHNVLKKGISRGVNQLLFERLTSDAFKDQDGHAAVQGVVAMATIFEYGQFQCLKLADLPQIIALLLEEKENVFVDAAKDISVWFKNISSDFQLISRNPGRSMQKVQAQNNHTQPLVTAREAGTYSSDQNNARSSETHAQSFQSNGTVFQRMSPHELSSFSTVPQNGHDALKQHASFSAVRVDDPAPGSTQSTATHELAEFSTVPNHVTHDYTGLSFPEIIPHELASISTNPRATPNSLFRSTPHSEFQLDIQNTLSHLPLDSNTTRMI